MFHELLIDDITLWVRVSKFDNHLNGINGIFIVDSLCNDIIDIERSLGSPFDKTPSLRYFGRTFRLYINGVGWGQSKDIVSAYQDYEYEFYFIAQAENEDSCALSNTVIWDCGDKTQCYFKDVQEIAGGDVKKLADQALRLIDHYRFYQPTEDMPTPSSNEHCTYSDDVAAVIVGSKPATIFNEFHLSKDPLLVLLLKEAYARGLDVQTVPNFCDGHSVVIGLPYNVREIVQIMSQAVRDNEVSSYFYERLGMLTGIPSVNVHTMIQNVKDFGFNRCVNC